MTFWLTCKRFADRRGHEGHDVLATKVTKNTKKYLCDTNAPQFVFLANNSEARKWHQKTQDLDHSAALVAAPPRCDLGVLCGQTFVIFVSFVARTSCAQWL